MAAKKKPTREEIAEMRAKVEAFDQERREEAEQKIADRMKPLDDLAANVLTPELRGQLQDVIDGNTAASPELTQLLTAIVRCIDVLPGTVEQSRHRAIQQEMAPDEPEGDGADKPDEPEGE